MRTVDPNMQRHDIDALAAHLQDTDLTDAKCAFLNLPFELRQQIYDYVVPVCRLAPFPYLDPEWSMRTAENRGPPSLMFVSRKIHDEVTPLVYSKAILEVAPVQQGHTFFDVQDRSTNKVIPFSYTRLSNIFRFYRVNHLKLIKRAHIFSNQADVIDGQCYEALLQWLIERTSVTDIQLSSRPMTRIRGKATFDLLRWRAVFYNEPFPRQDLRIIRIWTKAKRPPWEYEKMMRLRIKATDGSLSPMQIYFWASTRDPSDMQHNLQLDPKWTTRLNDEPEKLETLDKAIPLIDEYMQRVLGGQELQDYKDNSRHFDGDYWVYQMILVSERMSLAGNGSDGGGGGGEEKTLLR